MYQITAEVKQGVTKVKLSYKKSIVIVSLARIFASNNPQARQQLYMDFSIKDKQENFSNNQAIQQQLKQTFQNVVQISKYPGSVLKIIVYVINSDPSIQATIFNCCWLGMLRHGVPMLQSFCMIDWQSVGIKKHVMVNINKNNQIIGGSWKGQLPQFINNQAKEYKESILAFVMKQFV